MEKDIIQLGDVMITVKLLNIYDIIPLQIFNLLWFRVRNIEWIVLYFIVIKYKIYLSAFI